MSEYNSMKSFINTDKVSDFPVQDKKENLPQRLRDTENFMNEFITLLSFY